MPQSLDSNCPGAPGDGSVFSGDAAADESGAGIPRQQVVAGGALLLDLLLLACWIVASDWLLFRVGTFLTWEMFFPLAAVFLWSAKSMRSERSAVGPTVAHSSSAFSRRLFFTASIALLIFLLGFKLLWCGAWLQIVCGVGLLVTFAMVLAGHPPFLPEVLGFAIAGIPGAARRMGKFRFGTLNEATGVVKPILGLAILLPAMVVLAFSTLFVLANPNLSTNLALYLRTAWQATRSLLWSISPFEFVFWILSGWTLLGLLYPARCRLWNVGLLGITCVVIGFVLVVAKIIGERSFVWLLHRQLWVPCLAVVAFALLPVDWLVNNYNARQVLAGDVAPVVQIVAHRSSAEGMLPLLRLVDVDEPLVREGVRALLSLWADELNLNVAEQVSAAVVNVEDNPREAQELYGGDRVLGHTTPWLGLEKGFSRAVASRRASPAAPDWTQFQLAESQLVQRLRQRTDIWAEYSNNRSKRDAAIAAFFKYAYQWY